jgi:hypothetical protein
MVTQPTATDPTTVIVPNNRRWSIPGDQIRRATSDLPKDQADLIWWFAGWCREQDLTRQELGKLLKKTGTNEYYSTDSIVQLLTGGRARRGENIQPVLDAIEGFRKVESKRAEQASSGFIQTRLFEEIERRCLKALARQRIMFIFGESQIGKTESLKEVQRRHNHGQTVYVETPTGGNVTHFIFALAKQFAIPTKQGAKAGLRDRVIESFDSRMLLIVDEAHRALRPGSISGLETFSFLRELWNRRQCGIVISLTNEGRDQLLQGPHAAQLAQIWRRRITPLQLPSVPPSDDLDRFAAAYGLPPAIAEPITIEVRTIGDDGIPRTVRHTEKPLDLQTRILREEGLGVWITILQDASDMARDQRKTITWGAVLKAACQAKADAAIFI